MPVKIGSRLRSVPEGALALAVDACEFVVQGQGPSLNDMASGLIAPPLTCASVGVSRLGGRRGKREGEKDKGRVGQVDSGTKTWRREGVKDKAADGTKAGLKGVWGSQLSSVIARVQGGCCYYSKSIMLVWS